MITKVDSSNSIVSFCIIYDVKAFLIIIKPILYISSQLLPKDARVIRVMPNTPALVRSGTSVFVSGSKATEKDADVTRTLLKSVGTCEEVSENLLDAITALSGSGPAYVIKGFVYSQCNGFIGKFIFFQIYVLIESLADGGVKMGLPRDLAYRLAAQTVLGAGKMVRDTNIHPGILKDDVMSPAGSTAAGLYVLEQKGTWL